MTSKQPTAETASKKRGRPKKTDGKADDKPAVEKKARQSSKITAGSDGKKSVASKAKPADVAKSSPKRWEDIVNRADDELRASSMTISSVGSILSKRRSLIEPASSMSASPNVRFPLPHAGPQPQLRAQTASMSTKTSSTSSKSTNAAKARVQAQAAKALPTKVMPDGYKKASRQWTGILVSIPIVLVSSYWLYERLVLGKEQKLTQGNVLEKWFSNPDDKKDKIPVDTVGEFTPEQDEGSSSK